jgi:hypothetical protein
VDRRIKIVQLEQVFEPYCLLFKKVNERKKERKKQYLSVILQSKEKQNSKTLFFGGGGADNYSRISPFRGVSWDLTRAKSER